MGAKDVQQRPLDLASMGAAGSPVAPTDATHVDHSTTPSADGAAVTGNSLLASPADHVHPGVSESVILAADLTNADAVNWATLVTLNITTTGGTALAAQAHASTQMETPA